MPDAIITKAKALLDAVDFDQQGAGGGNMRFSWVSACAFAAWTAACWATGLKQQDLFTPDYAWLWWLPAFAWTLTAIRTAMGARG